MGRFRVVYTLSANGLKDAREKAFDVCVEQTIEFPYDLVADDYIKSEIVGRIESLDECGRDRYRTVISYDEETAGEEFAQFLNVVFGNSSIKSDVRVESIEPTETQLKLFSGPAFGAEGARELTGVYGRPLLCSAIKPMGLDVKNLADLAYRFALGGIDLIKDDHGLANQRFSPFEERVERCAEAVAKANAQTGGNCVYVPNITADGDATLERAAFAKKAGAKAVIVSGMLAGITTIRRIASDADLNMPVFFHPAFSGTFTTSPTGGFSHFAFYGQLLRLAGADAAIFPNFGGRFSYTREECASIAEGCRCDMGGLKRSLPAPGGGMRFENFAEMINFYGDDAVFLIGGGLFRRNPDITQAVKDLKRLIEDGCA